ncbi:MAG: DUF1559 domain-containing protein [Planctomycetaceae bacterium]
MQTPPPDLRLIYPAKQELKAFYCPSRRSEMTAQSTYANCQRLDYNSPIVTALWLQGGNDYAGCTGSGITFFDDPSGNIMNCQTILMTPAQLSATVITNVNNLNQNYQTSPYSQFINNVGIFGVNTHTSIRDITDGTSNVMMVSERRIFNKSTLPLANPVLSPPASFAISRDGWAWGGPATLFSTRYAPHQGLHYDEADSLHDQSVQALFADGTVHAITTSIDIFVWNNMGNMQQGSPLNVEF